MNNEPQHGDEIPTDLGGWNWFEAQAKHAQQATFDTTGLSAQELTYHFQRCFASKSGKIVLDHLQMLQDKYKDFDPELGFYNGAAFGFWRSGQKSIVQYLKTLATRSIKNELSKTS